MIMEHICSCKNSYKSRQGLHYHRKRCDVYNLIDQKEYYLSLPYELDTLKKQLRDRTESFKRERQQFRETICTLKNELEQKNNQINGVGKILTSQTKITRLLTEKSNDLSHLSYTISNETVDNEVLQGKPSEDYGQLLVDYFSDNELHKLLGNVIIAQYKKDNAMLQKIWSTDVSRLNYVVRDLVKNDELWKSDKGGVRVKEIVIIPLLSYINNILLHFKIHLSKQEVTEYVVNTKRSLNDLIKHIGLTKGSKESQMAEDINKYIAKYVHLDESRINQLIN